jgi:hypothetical protein
LAALAEEKGQLPFVDFTPVIQAVVISLHSGSPSRLPTRFYENPGIEPPLNLPVPRVTAQNSTALNRYFCFVGDSSESLDLNPHPRHLDCVASDLPAPEKLVTDSAIGYGLAPVQRRLAT